ncbi:hypothetical protein K7432_004133 [Basidiobolus ranarum]|uniref:Uncharacterized protein n=1 Tax=Basidiobolus ranarum TaxID=34480 RepID=A0ABR2WYY2_9FUNG
MTLEKPQHTSFPVDRKRKPSSITLPKNPYMKIDYSPKHEFDNREVGSLPEELESLSINNKAHNDASDICKSDSLEKQCDSPPRSKRARYKERSQTAYHHSLAVRYEQLLLRYMLLSERYHFPGVVQSFSGGF